jgi:hypothetical protein
MSNYLNAFDNRLPQTTPGRDVPIVGLPGLLDLLTAMEDQLASCPGIIPLLRNTLREELVEVVDDGGS